MRTVDSAKREKPADQGAVGIHLTGDTCEGLLAQGKFEKVGESIQLIKERDSSRG